MFTYEEKWCNIESQRAGITPSERLIELLLMPFYLALSYYACLNILKFYKKERPKKFDFIPKLQYILFSAAFCKIITFLTLP